ncbi:hypothetical protein EDB87DRAFT_1821128 [Lactarius vividus]|nr:hypothetical protein EDB87DRAFT_1821128 [Lactarius vividus]
MSSMVCVPLQPLILLNINASCNSAHDAVRVNSVLSCAEYYSRCPCHSFAHIQPAQPVLHSSFLNPPYKALHVRSNTIHLTVAVKRVFGPTLTNGITPKALLGVGRTCCPGRSGNYFG